MKNKINLVGVTRKMVTELDIHEQRKLEEVLGEIIEQAKKECALRTCLDPDLAETLVKGLLKDLKFSIATLREEKVKLKKIKFINALDFRKMMSLGKVIHILEEHQNVFTKMLIEKVAPDENRSTLGSG
ncbi:hypothetical protein DBR11_11865 [Pedobacter sp. HMWF019]|uniref:hypothetical protein n=1 Tax=Pedobacter sp. HMWF019 TaxID=2056856 RepID=UPI000D394CBE|nr:hypothetical protein [Pedobacter sp. HMWF019]PTS99677.1 hypothetical protein DBR11_11865 [Pedobacter sp. HMWF019]